MLLPSLWVAASCSVYAGTKMYNKTKQDKPRFGDYLYQESVGSPDHQNDLPSRGVKNSVYNQSDGQHPKFLEVLYTKFSKYKYNLSVAHDSELQNAEINVDPIETWIDKDFAISTGALILTVAGTLIYPPLMLVGAVGLAYLVIPVWHKAYHDLVHRRRITRMVVESFVLPGALLTGHFMAAALTYWFLYYSLNLMAKAKGHTTNNLGDVFDISSARSVWLQTKEGEIQTPLKEVQIGDVVIIQAGEIVPVDGIVIQGSAAIDQHMLTGEAQLAEKGVGDSVFATTMILSGRICIEVEQAGSQTISAQVGQVLNEMTHFTDLVELSSVDTADRWALPYLMLGGLATALFGPNGGVAVLYFPLDDALYSAGPLGVLNYLNIALKSGILVKDGRALELLREVDTIVFDKTGTLTQEQPHVAKVHTCNKYTEAEVLTYAAIAEHKQMHPIAQAILQAAEEHQVDFPAVQDAIYEIGYGLKVMVEDQTIKVGSARFMTQESLILPDCIQIVQNYCNEQGHSLVHIAIDDEMIGAIELHPTIRPEAEQIVTTLKEQGYELYIISGDHEKPTQALAQRLGIEHYFSETLPEDKARLIEQMQADGKSVCYIGDGINDAIALKQAEVSVSLRGASTVATDTAQVILMDGQLGQLIYLIELANELDKNLKNTLRAGIIPSVMIVGGIFFLHLSFSFAIACYMGGMIASVTNAMLPRVRHRLQRKL